MPKQGQRKTQIQHKNKKKNRKKKEKNTHTCKGNQNEKKDRKKSFSIQPVFSLFFMFHFFVKAIFFFKLIKAVFSML